MGQVIVMILKIIGILLLVILGIILVLLLTILLVPARYQVDVHKQEELFVKAKLTWLLHLVSVPVSYENGNTSACLKVFGITVKDFMEKPEAEAADGGVGKTRSFKKEKHKTKEKKQTKENRADRSEHRGKQAEHFENPAEGKSLDHKDSAENVSSEKTDPLGFSEKESKETEKKRKFSLRRIISEFLEKLKKLKYTIETFYDKIKKGIQKAGSVKEFLMLDTSKAALKLCGGQIFFLLKKISPRNIKGWVHFGMEDPALTGQILGGISAFYGFFPKKLELRPDFEQQVLECDLRIKGHLHLITAVQIVCRLFFDKNIKTAYKKIKSGF